MLRIQLYQELLIAWKENVPKSQILHQLEADRPVHICRKCKALGEGSQLTHVCGTSLESFPAIPREQVKDLLQQREKRLMEIRKTAVVWGSATRQTPIW